MNSTRYLSFYLAGIKIWRGRIAVIFRWRWKSSALQDGRVAQLSGLRHVDIDVHSGAVLVRVVVTRSSLWGRCRSVVSPPIQVVTQLCILPTMTTTTTLITITIGCYNSPCWSIRTNRVRNRTGILPELVLNLHD